MAGRHRISSPLFLFAAPDLLCCDMSPLVPHKRIASNLQMQRMSWPPLMTLLIPPDPPDPPDPQIYFVLYIFRLLTRSSYATNHLHRRGLLSSYLADVLPPPNSSQFSFSISAVSSSLNTINLLMSFASYCGVVLTSNILISSNAVKLSGDLIVQRGRPISISDPCAMQQLFTFGFWTTAASHTGRGELDPSVLSGEQTENGGCDIPPNKTLICSLCLDFGVLMIYWNFSSKSRHLRPFDYGSRVFQLLPANVKLSKLFEIHIVSSGSSVGASTEKGQFAPPLPCALTPTPKASHQNLLLVNSPSASYWCFNVVFDYQLFCRTIALEIKVKFLHGVLHLVELDSPLISTYSEPKASIKLLLFLAFCHIFIREVVKREPMLGSVDAAV
ncbi:hypothetical protein Bca4012_008284 [Brassica carinata]